MTARFLTRGLWDICCDGWSNANRNLLQNYSHCLRFTEMRATDYILTQWVKVMIEALRDTVDLYWRLCNISWPETDQNMSCQDQQFLFVLAGFSDTRSGWVFTQGCRRRYDFSVKPDVQVSEDGFSPFAPLKSSINAGKRARTKSKAINMRWLGKMQRHVKLRSNKIFKKKLDTPDDKLEPSCHTFCSKY